MPKLYDISEWNQQWWFNTGGTRNKKVYLNPEDNELYYFKESFKMGQRDYKHEFWSEIIASEVGEMLGLDILPYHIAKRGNVFGCLSKSMFSLDEDFIEGGKYIQAYAPQFKPENTSQRNEYTFDLIVQSLKFVDKTKYINDIIEVIVFDALIGNSDRHQENWGVIIKQAIVAEDEKGGGAVELGQLPRIWRWLYKKVYLEKGQPIPQAEGTTIKIATGIRFAPIYDSGCSFGRELTDEKVAQMLADKSEIEKYVGKGLAEIHWDKQKLAHFDLLERLLKHEVYGKSTLASLTKIINSYNNNRVNEIVNNVDNELVGEDASSKLPKARKQLIIQLLSLRFDKLRELHSHITR
jgi:hypothetical protein